MAPVASAVTRVLVTGFGPFQGVPNNPSWAIASLLPTTLPNNISLTIHPAPLPVAYHPVISTVPALIADVHPDIALHIGVVEGRTYFAVEQTSRRNVYGYSWNADIDGEVFTDTEGDAVWGDQPTVLSTELDLEAVVDEWQNRTEGIVWPEGESEGIQGKAGGDDDDEVRLSDNVGTYLCAFIYYTSMVEMGKERGQRDTAFMHVPLLLGEEEVQFGVEVTVELIQSLVSSWRAERAGGT
ncbi:peptidase C15, pyroglutamyl peptidase I-like protein [Bimuria novae-zelandiae CBS 107.79]|uniref:Peptidase C15, pyroglutamyl peptidase I-like protein n=1 Tax=Bimuria novae-zelandiae CBS 107.79 TaxID=1447943 RepID=A0A6A5VNX4_9PLEO|nr:peptidase C15, pyroglutamyl peptidase I-like protein [Bimuria novae-zelandiae CBS 107.79]